ncbi:MAG TPA: glycosyltransferase family 1 protein [Patescibacteria group bacterium]
MKILLDARLYGLENAGIGRYVVNLVGELSKIDSKNEYIILLGKKYFESLDLPSNWKKVLVESKHYSVSEQIKLPKIIAKYNPDLVHFLHFNVPILYRGKYVVTIHDLLMQTHRGVGATTLPIYLYYPKHLGSKFVFRKGVKSAKRIIVPSSAVRDEVCSYFKLDCNKVEVIYEGVDDAITGKISKSKIETPYFLYVGSAYPHKNLERAIQAATLLKTTLAIACARSVFLERLERLVQKNNASEFVKILGFVPDNELGGLYKNSLGFVFPSLSEGFGLPGLEAMARGTVVAASDTPVFKEIYKENAVYFDPYSMESIKEAMEKIVNMDESARSRMILKGKDFVKRYSWTKMAKETLDIYEKTAKSSLGVRSG